MRKGDRNHSQKSAWFGENDFEMNRFVRRYRGVGSVVAAPSRAQGFAELRPAEAGMWARTPTPFVRQSLCSEPPAALAVAMIFCAASSCFSAAIVNTTGAAAGWER
jgi:hypothetical protein